MFNAGLRAYSLTVLFLVLSVFSVQWQQCVSTAEDFPSDASSVGDDYISFNQQSFSTESTPAEDNFNELDNYDQDEVVKDTNDDNDDFDGEIESIANEKAAQKPYKDTEDAIIYGDTDGDIIIKELDDDSKWDEDRQDSAALSTSATTTTFTTTTTTTASPPTPKPVHTLNVEDNGDDDGDDGTDDSDMDESGFRSVKSGSNSYKDWLTNRRRRAHTNFEKYKAFHRNNRRYGHKEHKKNFGRYKKYEHHRSKHKDGLAHHHHHHQHHNHFHRALFDDKPYYQGQVSYYGQDDDSVDDSGIGVVVADKPYHMSAKMRSFQRFGQYHRSSNGRNGNFAGKYRSIGNYPNRNVKWPHLRRIEYQITKDERHEQNRDSDEDELPPYIRKYNRRNKQLLDLLEGTRPPSTTTTTTAPALIPAMVHYSDFADSSSEKRSNGKHDGASHVGGRSHFHNHRNPKWIMEDLFEEQRANPNNPKVEDDQYLNDSAMPSKSQVSDEVKANKKMSGKDTTERKDFSDEDDDSQESIGKEYEDEHLKSIQKNELPSASVISETELADKKDPLRGDGSHSDSTLRIKGPTVGRSKSEKSGAVIVILPTETIKISPKANQFIYHRVASPRSVGTGTNIIGVDGGSRKQRLPFVAITDRRLETSKMQKQSTDFQQNHLPLP